MTVFVFTEEPNEGDSTTTTQKFGLAWLFANTKKRERIERQRRLKQQKRQKSESEPDPRVQPIWVSLEASRGEARVKAVSRQVRVWKEDKEGKPSCTSTRSDTDVM